tara:strand:+ start:149 stop:511 length:363 start_codon:yes stop_codon:yes gene_type:complete
MKIIITESQLKKILKEGKNKSKDEIAISLSHKGMESLVNGLRYIESALQYVENDEIKKVLDEVRLSLLSNGGRQLGYSTKKDDRFDNIINVLGNMIDKHDVDNQNFNLNGDGPKAPTGEF